MGRASLGSALVWGGRLTVADIQSGCCISGMSLTENLRIQSRFHPEGAVGGGIPVRQDVAEGDTWDLSPIFPDASAWQREFDAVAADYLSFQKYKGRMGESVEMLVEALDADAAISLRLERLQHYAGLRSSEDSSDAANLAREGVLSNLLTRISEAASFFTPEIQAIPEEVFQRFLEDDRLAIWRIPLRKIRRFREHTLSEREERLMALADAALGGHGETFSQLTNVDMHFAEVEMPGGTKRPLSQSAFSSFLVHPEASVRAQAFRKFYDEFDDHKYTVASTLAASVKADVFRARARNYPSAREAALFRDDVPVSVYDQLIASVRGNLEPLHRYYSLRKRILGLKDIHHYDTYVPLVGSVQMRTRFDEAIGMVVEALSPLGSEYCSVLEDGLTRARWCDRYENKGKRSGAFSSGGFGVPPYILMNYKEDVFSDVYTLAHEAGHSMHTWYSAKTQPYQTYDYPIFLAEVASTFNEELLTHHLLAKASDPAMRAYLICRQIDDIRGTVYRQTMFAEFEKLIHAAEEAGEALTLDVFRAMYRGLLDTYFGQDFAVDDVLELECLRIPHFYNAFYVYKYATGLSAAVSLSDQVLREGASAVERYLGFLKSGGSEFPLPTLVRAGVDLSTPKPVDDTLRLFAARVAELESLLG